MRRWILGSGLFIGVMSALNVLCLQQTDGFFPYQIPASLPHHPEWECAPLSQTDRSELLEILSQPFTYLGKGHQCFVFESKDQRTILKFPFHSQLIPPVWMRPIPLLSDLFRTHVLHKRQGKLHKDAMSYRLAYERLKMETGVLFIHLNRTQNTLPPVTIYDKIGVQHQLPLDNMEFIVQKKAEQIYPTLAKWIEGGQIDRAKQGLSELVALFALRFERGIEDRECVLNTNYGFLEGRAMQIDIGRLRECTSILSLQEQVENIWGVFEPLTAYLELQHPELADHLAWERARYEKPIRSLSSPSESTLAE